MSPCNFQHEERDISLTVHGDDFLGVAERPQLDLLLSKMKSSFELKSQILGPGKDEHKQMKILNRNITWRKEGLVYEPDPRHAEIIVEQLGLKDAKSVETPTEEPKKWEAEK